MNKSETSIPSTVVFTIGDRPKDSRKIVKMINDFVSTSIMTLLFGGAVLTSAVAIKETKPFVLDLLVGRDAPKIAQETGPVWLENASPIVWLVDSEKYRDEYGYEKGLIGYFQNKGLTGEQAAMVTANLKVASQVYVLGSGEEKLQTQLLTRQNEARTWLNEAWRKVQTQPDPEKVKEITFKSNSIFEEFLTEFHLTPVTFQAGDSDSQYAYVLMNLLRSADSLKFKNNLLPNFDTKKAISMSMEEARDHLTQAVESAGIAAYVVNHNVLEAPYLLEKSAIAIETANEELQKATGWNGGVLGLNNRVIINTEYYSMSGSARSLPNGYISLKADWATISHEWFHTLDFLQSRYIFGAWKGTTLSDYLQTDLGSLRDKYHLNDRQRSLMLELKNPQFGEEDRQNYIQELRDLRQNYQSTQSRPLFIVLQNASDVAEKNGVPLAGSPWFHYRKTSIEMLNTLSFEDWAKNNKWDPKSEYVQKMWEDEKQYAKKYLYDETEMFAFAFQGYISVLNHSKDIRFLNGDLKDTPPTYSPTLTEAMLLENNWKNYFSNLKTWWSVDTSERFVSGPPQHVHFVEAKLPDIVSINEVFEQYRSQNRQIATKSEQKMAP